MASPKLRFKDDQGQEFPAWEDRNIGHYLREKNIKTAETPTIPLMAFVANKGIVPKGARYDRSALIKTENKQYKRTDYGDFIYSSNNLDVGSIGLNLYGSVVISPVYEVFSAKEDVNLACLNMLLQCPRSLYKILRYRQGVTYGQLRIHPKDFLNITLCFPTIPEQRKIADFLSSYDALIDYQSQRLETLQKRKLGLLQRVFSRELRFRDDNGNDFPDWEEKRLGDVASIKTGTKPTSSIKDTAPFKYINAGTTNSGYIDNFNHEGNVITTPSRGQGGIGYVGYQSGKFWLGPLCYGIMSCKEEVLTQYLYYFLLRFNQLILDLKKVGSIPAVNRKDLLEISVQLPSLEEQKKIADFFGAVDAQIEVEADRLESMKTIKKGLLQQMFM